MTQSADGPEAHPQPPHVPVEAEEQPVPGSSTVGDQPADEGQDVDESWQVTETGMPPQHPSFDDAEGDPWGQAPSGGNVSPMPPWYGAGQQYADVYQQDQPPEGTTAGASGQGQSPGSRDQAQWSEMSATGEWQVGAGHGDADGTQGSAALGPNAPAGQQASFGVDGSGHPYGAGQGQEPSDGDSSGHGPGAGGPHGPVSYETGGASAYLPGSFGPDAGSQGGAPEYPPGAFGQSPGVEGAGQPYGAVGHDAGERESGGYAGDAFGQLPVSDDAGGLAHGGGAFGQDAGQRESGGYAGDAFGQDAGQRESGGYAGDAFGQDVGQRESGGYPVDGYGQQQAGFADAGGYGAPGAYSQEQVPSPFGQGQDAGGYQHGAYGHQYPQEPGYQPQPPQQGARPEVVNPFLEQSNAIPRRGMRRAVYRATFGAVNLGPSDEERAARARRERVARPLHGSWRVVVMSIKGGVGKTTTAAMLGRTLAEWRGDRVVALDTNPDMGTLGDRLVGATDVTVRGLLAHEARAPIQQVAEVNRFTNLAGRLHVLANEQDPAVSEDFTGVEYQQTLNILERFYNVIIADCGTGVLRPWVRDMLSLANTLVVVAEPKGDAATRAAGTLDWIAQHGFYDLVNRSVAVINYRSPTPKSLDVDALTNFFAERCRSVCKIRYDEHLDLGVQIQYDPIPDAPAEAYVADATKEDYLELAATIADEFR